jgi:hypothetical protein
MKLLIRAMSRFAVPPELIGDITEDAANHSALWFIREVDAAILNTVCRDLWNHKWETLKSLTIPWVATFLWSRGLVISQSAVTSQPSVAPRLIWSLFVVVTFPLWPGFMAWAAGKLHRTQPLGAALLLVLSFLAQVAYYFATHWTELQHSPMVNRTSVEIRLRFTILALMLLGCLLVKPARGKETPA